MALKYIEYEVENRIGYITLNRPEKRNAFNETLVAELKGAFKLAARDTNVKVIVLRANGAVFSAGADLEALRKMQNNTYPGYCKNAKLPILRMMQKCKTTHVADVAKMQHNAYLG